MTRSLDLKTFEAPTITFFGGLKRAFALHRQRRQAILDPRDLSDHLLRDLGLLDGKTPAGTIR